MGNVIVNPGSAAEGTPLKVEEIAELHLFGAWKATDGDYGLLRELSPWNIFGMNFNRYIPENLMGRLVRETLGSSLVSGSEPPRDSKPWLPIWENQENRHNYFLGGKVRMVNDSPFNGVRPSERQ